MTTSVLWDVALNSTRFLDCDNEIPGDAAFKNVSEGPQFSLCCSLKIYVRTWVNTGIIYCDLFLSSVFCWKTVQKFLSWFWCLLDPIAKLFSHVCFWASHWNQVDFWFCRSLLSHHRMCGGASTLRVPRITAKYIPSMVCICCPTRDHKQVRPLPPGKVPHVCLFLPYTLCWVREW